MTDWKSVAISWCYWRHLQNKIHDRNQLVVVCGKKYYIAFYLFNLPTSKLISDLLE